MPIQIAQIRKKTTQEGGKESQAGKYGALAGAAIGGLLGAAGGPGAALGGAGAGASLGGLVGGMFGKSEAPEVKETVSPQAVEIDDSAMTRRLAGQRQDRLAILQQAEAALQQLPKELRQEYASPIVQATMMEERRKAMAGRA